MSYPPRNTANGAEMERMRRHRARQNAIATAVLLAFVCAILGTGCWLLTHPEAIGSFVGRIMAGARSAT
jgi:hypothetical protein